MKAQRRHELRDNDLVHYLQQGRDYLNEHGSKLAVALFVVAIVVFASLWVVRSRGQAVGQAWISRSALTFDELEQGRINLESLVTLTSASADRDFVLSSLKQQGEAALHLASLADPPPDRELNDKAKRAFGELLSRYPDDPTAIGAGHTGLATVAANEFVLDGNPAHKETARHHLEQVRDSELLTGLPFQTFALARLNKLDQAFTPVTFAPPLPQEEEIVEGSEKTAPQPPTTPPQPGARRLSSEEVQELLRTRDPAPTSSTAPQPDQSSEQSVDEPEAKPEAEPASEPATAPAGSTD